MSNIVSVERAGTIALVTLDNPPVNAAGHALRVGLLTAIEELDTDDSIEVIALFGAGRTFIAGADIREFGKPSREPMLPEVCDRIESSQTPVIAVLHGTALGGGLETAMSAHVRIGLEGMRVGLPEVTLGILPGAGGTQRAPRLVGLEPGLEMMTSGRHIKAAEALALGLIDRLETGEVRDIALAACKDVLSGALPHRRTCDISIEVDTEIIETWRQRLLLKVPHLFSPHRIVDAVEACDRPIAEGLVLERQLFNQCMETPQRAGLIHAFFSERAVAKIPEAKAQALPFGQMGVVGGGTMGSGIATAMLMAGLNVTLVERNAEAAERTRATITGNLDGGVKRGKLTQEKRDTILGETLTIATDLEALSDADLIVEAVFEEMAIKKEVFEALDRIAGPDTILASNTSYLDINEIASATNRAEKVIGLHFFSPAHIMRLLEVVVADKTAPDVVATGFALAKKLRKVAVRAGVCDGFIGNRILSHFKKVADYLMLDGAAPEQIDQALEDFGFAMGPFAVSDLAGLDISWAERKRKAAFRPETERYVAVADRMCEQGWFGRKTGKGFYIYEGRERTVNPEVLKIIQAERQSLGIVARSFSDAEIVERYMTAMISEAARVVEDGIALRPIDVDAVFLFGYGFPRFRGGPLHYADHVGATELVTRIEHYAAEDPDYWQCPKILKRMALDGSTFAELN